MLKEIATGMRITLGNFFKKRVTVQYPKQMRNVNPRFRGAVAFVRDQETGKERCVGCGLCAAICPANCLTVVPGVDEYGIRNAKIYLYDMSRCVFCGMCVEVCPELALVMTHEFELATDDRSKMILDAEAMLKLADREKERSGVTIEEPGFPAITDGRGTFIRHDELDPRIQRGKFQSHQPLLGTAPHGYPMAYKDYLGKIQKAEPLADGTLPSNLVEIQNKFLPEDAKTPLPRTTSPINEETEDSKERTNLETVADTTKIEKHEYVEEYARGIIKKLKRKGEGYY
jgi:NADH-quinone oxidoreductase subunit I